MICLLISPLKILFHPAFQKFRRLGQGSFLFPYKEIAAVQGRNEGPEHQILPVRRIAGNEPVIGNHASHACFHHKGRIVGQIVGGHDVKLPIPTHPPLDFISGGHLGGSNERFLPYIRHPDARFAGQRVILPEEQPPGVPIGQTDIVVPLRRHVPTEEGKIEEPFFQIIQGLFPVST